MKIKNDLTSVKKMIHTCTSRKKFEKCLLTHITNWFCLTHIRIDFPKWFTHILHHVLRSKISAPFDFKKWLIRNLTHLHYVFLFIRLTHLILKMIRAFDCLIFWLTNWFSKWLLHLIVWFFDWFIDLKIDICIWLFDFLIDALILQFVVVFVF